MEKKRADIDRLSSILEKEEFSPVAARVYVYLLFCGNEGCDFDEIVNYFSVSKSAISNALNLLQSKSLVDSRTFGGQRKRNFFALLSGASQETTSVLKLERIASFFTELKNTRNINDKFSCELENVALLCNMFRAEFPIIIERWKNLIKEQNKTKDS